jgi:hypothetical protein
LELGAELISSDAVAIYELVKNAIDAGSPDGVTIEFGITLRHSDYIDALGRIDNAIEETERRLGPNKQPVSRSSGRQSSNSFYLTLLKTQETRWHRLSRRPNR